MRVAFALTGGHALTIFDSLLCGLQNAADYNRNDTSTAAVLLPDEKREWEKLIPRLRSSPSSFLDFRPLRPNTSIRSRDLVALRAGRENSRRAPTRRHGANHLLSTPW